MEKIEYLVIEGNFNNKEEAIDRCAEELIKNEITDSKFATLCKEREKEFPTGIPSAIPVAIPHAKYVNIAKNCICILKLDNPVKFNRMDETEESIEVKMIFNLAIKDSDKHIDVLMNLINLFSDEQLIENLYKSDKNEIVEILRKVVG